MNKIALKIHYRKIMKVDFEYQLSLLPSFSGEHYYFPTIQHILAVQMTELILFIASNQAQVADTD